MHYNLNDVEPAALSDQEIERETAAELPNREAMSLIDPGALSRPIPLDGSMTGISQPPIVPDSGLPQPLLPVPGPTPA